eukprot:Nk52_evm82s1444 gene=Nk52_evmTU82s1444
MGDFNLKVSTLQNLIDPKDRKGLEKLGGVGPVSKKLFSDPEKGLPTTQLDSSQLERRRKFYGTNVLPEAPSKAFLEYIWEGLQDNTLIMLMISAAVSFVLGIHEDPSTGWIEGTAIMVAVVVVVMVAAFNDYEKELQFRKLNAKKEAKDIKVIRAGKPMQIPIHEVVVGELVQVETGDILAADGIFVSGSNIECDESMATGESDMVKKGTCESGADPFFLSGSQVMNGVGRMIVIAVGVHSFHGKTMMSLRVENEETPLQEKLTDLAELIGKFGIAAAGLSLTILTCRHLYYIHIGGETVDHVFFSALVKYVITAITIVVVAVPEGLPLAVTMALAYSMTQMLYDNNLVRRLEACETMGGATQICSDKTGTLTLNEMTVVKGYVCCCEFDLNRKLGQSCPKSMIPIINESIAANSTAYEITGENGVKKFIGSKTDGALLKMISELGCDYLDLREKTNEVVLYPFSSQNKRSSVVVKRKGGQLRHYVKGAGEIVFQSCTSVVDGSGQVTAISKKIRDEIDGIIHSMATDSLRTICIAYSDIEQKASWEHPPNDELTLIGIVGIEDPVRPEVPEAVRVCQKAGITVRMVTGDNKVTAKNIASTCGIYSKGGLILEGPEFRKLEGKKLSDAVRNLQVLARSSPLDKQILVRELKAQGHVVAVTGDGTNDGPALKLAHVGFSMGVTGTEVAKEASDIVLMDDNFSSIVKAVAWGRNVYDSIRKFLQFQLTVNIAAVVLAFVGALSDDHGASPLKPVQLLWVNLIMDTMAALALATEKPSAGLLNRKPYGKDEPLITALMWKNIIGQSVFQLFVNLGILYYGHEYFNIEKGGVEHLTIFFNAFVICQIFNEINARRIHGEINVFSGMLEAPLFLAVMIFTIIGQYLIVEFGGSFAGTTSLNQDEWIFCLGVGALSVPVGFILRLGASE